MAFSKELLDRFKLFEGNPPGPAARLPGPGGYIGQAQRCCLGICATGKQSRRYRYVKKAA